ncbi:uncharacterized protein LOC108666173 [Hyalella azteca]|uniref:Uncharacterized protein LOC108666173 n=1 Tax=Hyalella azteca TaxID=294128 RepID=A0A8B7N3P9_HYAAZ|nr:uncharacterized protein LOC108666173 [Hyalella azteca]
MASFCRITGHARNLPKPHYFPLLPPISPADAKKLCRITGRVTDLHHYSPIVAFGKPIKFDGVIGCRITMFENFTFARPIFIKTKENEKAFDYLEEVMVQMKNKKKKGADADKKFAYDVHEHKITIVVPPEMEEAIRCGEIENFSINKDCKLVQIKIRSGRIIKLNLEGIPKEEIEASESIFYGEGQSKEVLAEQQSVINERNKRKQDTMARKKLFEEKEKKEEELERRDIERPKSKKPLVMSHKKRAEKKENMEKMLEEHKSNKSIVLPNFEAYGPDADPDEIVRYEMMLEEIAKAQKTSHSLVVCSTGFDWNEEKTAAQGFDWDNFPAEVEDVKPIEVSSPGIMGDEKIMLGTQLITLNIVAAVETLEPAAAPSPEILTAISELKKDKRITKTEKVAETIKEFDCIDVVATFDEISKISSKMSRADIGFLVQRDGDTQFIPKTKFKETDAEGRALSGAMVEIDDNKVKKFVTGQIIHLADGESFVAGQTMVSDDGKRFVPGHTVVDRDGEIKFIPGQSVVAQDGSSTFMAGQLVDTPTGPRFVPGQMLDRGDGKPVFIPGQTITTTDGPKFVPGEIVKDEEGFDCFVPGLPMPTEVGNTFVPGQTFQDEIGNVSFTPGQIVDTVEGPVFVPGKTFKTDKGEKKFVKGEIIRDKDGSIKFVQKEMNIPAIREELVIPSEELIPIAIAGKNVTGFAVNPTNTLNIEKGEKLIGDMVETANAVQFYLTGKMPDKMIAEALKIISGKLEVGEDEQRFIPGRVITTAEGEKFVPGQLVMTSHGEDFVPGQIVETKDGPKFVPGQMVMTSEGEKFVPGQVIIEKSGPRFVPGQIIQTKSGATFIPGQMMNTNEGQKFVPGQLVESVDGPRFVPGQVIETAEGPKFVPGTVIETEDGLKYVPHEAEETGDEDIAIAFQGFEVTPEEMHLLTVNPTDARAHSPITNDQCLIDTRTLKRLASDTMEIHGKTPEPQPEKKKMKKAKKRVAIEAPDDEEVEVEEEVVEIDEGTDKLEILKMLFNAANTVSNVKKSREMKKVKALLGDDASLVFPVETSAVAKILSSASDKDSDIIPIFLGPNEELVHEVMSQISSLDDVTCNDQVKKMIGSTLKSVVTNKCNQEISKMIGRLKDDPSCLMTDAKIQILLTEAVGIVCVLGDVEVASLLEKFISEPSDPSVLTDDPEVMNVLRQLLVLHEAAERDDDIAKLLQILRTNPEGLKSKKQIRAVLKKANKLLVEPSEYSKKGKKFDVRHVASSRDIPEEVFQQLKADKEEADKFLENLPDELFHAIMGDERAGNQVLEGLDQTSQKAKADIARFRQGMAVVVTQSSVQAVIPRRYARSVYYGIMPYLLIDEQGFKFFERGLTGRKLAPSKIIENTWFKDDDYYKKQILYTKSGEKCSVNLMGRSTPSLYYTCLLPTSEPKLVTRDALLQERRGSRSRRPSGESSRRSSVSSIHGDYSYGGPYNPMAMAPYEPSSLMSIDPSTYVPNIPTYTPTYVPDPVFASEPTYVPEGAYSNGYSDPSMYGAVIPYPSPDLEPVPSVKRSDTVGRLLDKYCNFSTEREFYHPPTAAYSKYTRKSGLGPDSTDDETLSEHQQQSYTKPPRSHKSSKDRGTNDTDYHSRFSNIYEEDEDAAYSPPTKHAGPKSPYRFAVGDQGSSERDLLNQSADSEGRNSRYKGSPTSRVIAAEPFESRATNVISNVVADPFALNAGYFNLGRFDDPIAERYSRNVCAYSLPEDLDAKYGRSRYGYQNPNIGDPVLGDPYGMMGASDQFTPNYTSRYSRYHSFEPGCQRGMHPPVQVNGDQRENQMPYEIPDEQPRFGKKKMGYESPSASRKFNGAYEELDEKPDLGNRISRFLKPKNDGDGRRVTSRYGGGKTSRFSSENDDVRPSYTERTRYGRFQPDPDEVPPNTSRYSRTPQRTYGAGGSGRTMTTPGLSSYLNDDHLGGSPSRYRNTRASAVRDTMSPLDDESPYVGRGSRYGLPSQAQDSRGKSSARDDGPSFGESLRKKYGISPDPDEEGSGSYNPRSSVLRSAPTSTSYSELVPDEDRPWRRHTSVTRRKPFILPTYDDDDDDNDDTSYNPKQTERQLASRIAKQYLGNGVKNDDDDGDE